MWMRSLSTKYFRLRNWHKVTTQQTADTNTRTIYINKRHVRTDCSQVCGHEHVYRFEQRRRKVPRFHRHNRVHVSTHSNTVRKQLRHFSVIELSKCDVSVIDTESRHQDGEHQWRRLNVTWSFEEQLYLSTNMGSDEPSMSRPLELLVSILLR